MIGETMFITGLAMFLTAPIVGRLIGKVDPRYLMMTGFISFGIGNLDDVASDQSNGISGSCSGRRSSVASG